MGSDEFTKTFGEMDNHTVTVLLFISITMHL